MNATMKLTGLDATRFLAALAILLFHLVRMPSLDVPDWLAFVPNSFALGVPLFYAVSAFSLYFGYFGKIDHPEHVQKYFLRRFFRIAPLFYFMLGFHLAYMFLRYGKTFSVPEIVASIFFVFNLIPKYVSGIVWASWSIGVEMLFYVVLPVLLVMVTDIKRALLFFCLAVFVSELFRSSLVNTGPPLTMFTSFSLVSHLPYFAGGIVSYFTWKRIAAFPFTRTANMIGYACIMISVLAFSCYALGTLPGKLHSWHMAGAYRATMIGFFLVGISLMPVHLLVNIVTIKLGKASYSLYLWHPIVISLTHWSGAYKALYYWFNDGPAYLLCAVVTLAVLIPLALISYRWIELPGMALAGRFGSRQPHAPKSIPA